jgi:UDP-N-acetylglucosamine--N-acetylmuramyl-(pentapeptide) pyrophosphoryl-undecaprenol N-acetylglucosamine transferase
MTQTPTILFAGGGTGGHLFPSLAIAERVLDDVNAPECHFVSSNRPLDADILQKVPVSFTPLSVQPLPTRLRQILPFIRNYRQSTQHCRKVIQERNVQVVISMGGFVSGPAMAAAAKNKIPTVLVNLDAVPGKANRWLARRCDRVFSCFETPSLGANVERVAMPLRRSALSTDDAVTERERLGLDPTRPTLLITGASQGAGSVNNMMIALAGKDEVREALKDWQILHLAGIDQTASVTKAYDAAGLTSRVIDFCDQMGSAWGSADLAISRAGAGSVAEAAANGVPCFYLPYPYHKDQHQRLNARPWVDAGGAEMFEDEIDPAVNSERFAPRLVQLLGDDAARATMRSALRAAGGVDGAQQLADVAAKLLL